LSRKSLERLAEEPVPSEPVSQKFPVKQGKNREIGDFAPESALPNGQQARVSAGLDKAIP
jgi:hypothetical protein